MKSSTRTTKSCPYDKIKGDCCRSEIDIDVVAVVVVVVVVVVTPPSILAFAMFFPFPSKKKTKKQRRSSRVDGCVCLLLPKTAGGHTSVERIKFKPG